MLEAPSVERVSEADVTRLATVLARSFLDDPVSCWAFDREPRRFAKLERFFELRLRTLIPQDVCFTTPEREGAALWALPGRWVVPIGETLRLMGNVGPRRLPLVGRGLATVERRHPKGRHFYLAVLGTDPDHQGRGVGSALLRPVLDMCDSEGIPAYLETGKERNLSFYGRHGFEVTERLELPNGPPIWLMWRDPG
ncbi:MAG: GNAT family N-acetyltransferase [Thermoleophilaceae bacterium]